tara:strand:- start:4719 stop:5840 length:1122 start_codon:yes stop_codon:yes gene_type:complete
MEMFGLSTKVKLSGTWTEIDAQHVKISGVWKPVARSYAKLSGTWTETWGAERTVKFTKSDTPVTTGNDRVYAAPTTDGTFGVYTDIDLDSYFSSDDKDYPCRAIVDSDVYIVASATSAFAIKTGASYTKTITIENNGNVLGRGGAGGTGGNVVLDSTPTYTGTYTGVYTGIYTGAYTGTYSTFYSGREVGPYSGSYSGDYSGGYSGDYSGGYVGNIYDATTATAGGDGGVAIKLFNNLIATGSGNTLGGGAGGGGGGSSMVDAAGTSSDIGISGSGGGGGAPYGALGSAGTAVSDGTTYLGSAGTTATLTDKGTGGAQPTGGGKFGGAGGDGGEEGADGSNGGTGDSSATDHTVGGSGGSVGSTYDLNGFTLS